MNQNEKMIKELEQELKRLRREVKETHIGSPEERTLLKDIQVVETKLTSLATVPDNSEELHHKPHHSVIKADIQEVQHELQVVRQRLKRLKFRKYARIATFVVIVLTFFFSWVRLFDVLTLDTRFESLTIWLGEPFTQKAFHKDILIIAIPKKTIESHKTGTSWWPNYAKLVDLLSQAGAKVIAFDMAFENPMWFEQEFIDAIHRAKTGDHKTAVIVSIHDLEDGKPKMVKELRDVVSGAGAFCIGEKIGYAQTIPLTILKTSLNALQETSPYIPSLALAVVEAYRDETYEGSAKIHRDNYQLTLWDLQTRSFKDFEYSELFPVKRMQAGCPVIQKNDTTANLLFDLSPLNTLRASTWTYNEIIRATPEALTQFKDKIVLVGKETEHDIHAVFRGITRETRSGLELHADAIKTVLNGVTIRSLGTFKQFIIMSCLGILGASIRYRMSSSYRYYRLGVLFIIIVSYLSMTVYVYSQYHLLLNVVYHLGALWFSYLLTGQIERRWFYEIR